MALLVANVEFFCPKLFQNLAIMDLTIFFFIYMHRSKIVTYLRRLKLLKIVKKIPKIPKLASKRLQISGKSAGWHYMSKKSCPNCIVYSFCNNGLNFLEFFLMIISTSSPCFNYCSGIFHDICVLYGRIAQLGFTFLFCGPYYHYNTTLIFYDCSPKIGWPRPEFRARKAWPQNSAGTP